MRYNLKTLVILVMTFFGMSSLFAAEPLRGDNNRICILLSDTIINTSCYTNISVVDIATIKRKELETITGRKMNLTEAVSLKIIQKRLKRVNDQSARKNKPQFYGFGEEDNKKFHLGGFLLGFFGMPWGILIAYLFHDENRKKRIRWMWRGVAAILSIVLLLFLLVPFVKVH